MNKYFFDGLSLPEMSTNEIKEQLNCFLETTKELKEELARRKSEEIQKQMQKINNDLRELEKLAPQTQIVGFDVIMSIKDLTELWDKDSNVSVTF